MSMTPADDLRTGDRFPQDAVMTDFPELDAFHPLRIGSVIGVYSDEWRAASHFTLALARSFCARAPQSPPALVLTQAEELLEFWSEDEPREQLFVYWQLKAAHLTQLSPETEFDRSFLTSWTCIEDYHHYFPIPRDLGITLIHPERRDQPDVPGLSSLVFPVSNLCTSDDVNDYRARSADQLLERVTEGEFHLVVLRFDGFNDGNRNHAFVVQESLLHLIAATNQCQEAHGFSPTILWSSPPADWCRRADLTKGPGAGGGLLLQELTDLTIGVSRASRPHPSRPHPLTGPDELEFHYELTARDRIGRETNVNAGFVAYRPPDKAMKRGLRSGDWDEAGRMMELLGLKQSPTEALVGTGAIETRRQLLLAPATRLWLRNWLRGCKDTPPPKWLGNQRDKNLIAPPSSLGVIGLRLAGGGPSDPALAARVERARVRKIADRLCMRPVPGSGSGRERGDIKGGKFLIEVQCVLNTASSTRISMEKLKTTVANAHTERSSPCFCLSFVEDDHEIFWIGHLLSTRNELKSRIDNSLVKGRTIKVDLTNDVPSLIRFDGIPEWEWTLVSEEELVALDR